MQEPLLRSPESFFRTLMFREYAGEVAEGEKLTDHAALRNMLEECRQQLEMREIKDKRKGLLMPVALVASMERLVVDESATNYARCYSWFRLLKIWAGLRFMILWAYRPRQSA